MSNYNIILRKLWHRGYGGRYALKRIVNTLFAVIFLVYYALYRAKYVVVIAYDGRILAVKTHLRSVGICVFLVFLKHIFYP